MSREILLVDSDKDLSTLISFRLESKGFNVTSVSSGFEALIHVKEKKPDLIITEIMMPEMDGFEVCERIKGDKSTSNIPVIFLTTLTNKEYLQKAQDLGVKKYMVKPFDGAELVSVVEESLVKTGLSTN
ncbi:MAG: response regulator [Armatimonadota bacterium]